MSTKRSIPKLVSSKADLQRRELQKKKAKSGGFESLGLSSNVFRGIKRKGYKVPTPIQRKTMPLILAGADVVAMARTGSGKTAAFLIPMLEKLMQHVPQAGVRALILSPTRDLALQTFKFCKELGKYTDLRVSLQVGGDSMQIQFEELAHSPDVIIATPGRLMHHLSEVDDMSLRSVEYVVFDEADSLFDMGFSDQLHQILKQLSENRQTLLFGATMPQALEEFAKAGLRGPQLVTLDVENKISPDLKLHFFTLRPEEKYAALLFLINRHIPENQQTIIFASTKHHVEFLNILLTTKQREISVCYGDMDQDARKIHVSKFRSTNTKLLIVTDIAARGIDIPLLDNVINWDFPSKPKLFVHRVGRAARAGRTGTAYSFVTSDDLPYLLDLHLFLSKPIKPAPTAKEVLQDPKKDFAKGETVYGRFPQTALDLDSDSVRKIIDSSTELDTLQKTCKNAFQLYSKTKPTPSKESIRRAKELPREGLHPMFKSALEGNELSAVAYAGRIKSFRPKQTVMEAEGDNSKPKHKQQGPCTKWGDVMKRKREVHDKTIQVVHDQSYKNDTFKEDEPEVDCAQIIEKKDCSASKRKATSFVDKEYFISSVPTNQNQQYTEAGLSIRGDGGFGSNRLESAVLDLVADDSAGMAKQKSVYHWDKRSKKYVKLNNGERVTANGKVKTEGGKKVTAKKTGIYQKWKARTHNKVSNRGNDYKGNDIDRRGGGMNFRGGKRPFIPNADVPSEIKDLEQVRKERQKKANNVSNLKNKKGKKSGKSNGRSNCKSGKSYGAKPSKSGGAKNKSRGRGK